MARIHGAGLRVATDLAGLRLTKARELYADVTINASTNIHSVFHCGTNWRPVLKLLQKYREVYRFDCLISHRMSLDELVADMAVVTIPNECVKVEVVPHAD